MCMPHCRCGGQKTERYFFFFIICVCGVGWGGGKRLASGLVASASTNRAMPPAMMVSFFDVLVLGGEALTFPGWSSSADPSFSVVSVSCRVPITSELSGL